MNTAFQSGPPFHTKTVPGVLRCLRMAGLLCVLFAVQVRAGVSTAPLLLSDDFDTSNTVGAVPAGWMVSAPAGTTVRVVDASVKAPFSAPYCVELVDNSPTGRPQMYREFSASEAGRARAAFLLNSPATAHAALQLRTSKGVTLCSAIFASNGFMRYQQQGGSANSTTPWTPGQWQDVQIEWFNDFTFSASVNGKQFAERAHFIAGGTPGRIYVIIGYETMTNRIGYVDNVKVLGAGQR